MNNRSWLWEIIVTLVLIALIVGWLGYVVRPLDAALAYAQIESFHSLPQNSVEVIVYGSSRAFRGFDPIRAYEQYGIGSYNYSWNWQKINTTRMFIKDSLAVQTPKAVLIEAFFADSVLSDENISPEIYYSRYIYDRKAKKEYLRQCFGTSPEKYLYYYIPLFAFHENWNSLSVNSFLPLQKDPKLRKDMGFSRSTVITKTVIPDPSSFRQKELCEEAIAVLEDIVSCCRAKGAEVVFFTVPCENSYAYGEALAQFAKANGCAYFDFYERAEEIGIDGETDFSDEGHLNSFGAEKVTDFLCEYLAERCDLTDMRSVEHNLWEAAINP